MGWECRACGRVHDVDPGTCACGSEDLRPRDDRDDRLGRLRADLFAPGTASTDLLGAGPYVALAFRLVVASAALLAAALALAWLL